MKVVWSLMRFKQACKYSGVGNGRSDCKKIEHRGEQYPHDEDDGEVKRDAGVGGIGRDVGNGSGLLWWVAILSGFQVFTSVWGGSRWQGFDFYKAKGASTQPDRTRSNLTKACKVIVALGQGLLILMLEAGCGRACVDTLNFRVRLGLPSRGMTRAWALSG